MLDERFASVGQILVLPGSVPSSGGEPGALLIETGPAIPVVVLSDGPSLRARQVAPLRLIIERAGKLGSAIPMPAVLRRNVTRREAAFIAAAYAIPLPGTALVAALLVGARRFFLRLRARWSERSLLLAAGNG